MLLGASYVSRASWQAPYLLAVLLMVTGVSCACGLRMAAGRDDATSRRWLRIGSLSCLAALALFKYLPFLKAQAGALFGVKCSLAATTVSIGVSYVTFQAVSYLADVYLELEEPEHHFGHFALYLAFFPKLLQGPIERSGTLLPQLKKPYRFDYASLRSGMVLFTWGLYNKALLADRLASDWVYGNVYTYSGLSLVLGTYAYALQIYFDFSACIDLARGTARLFSIDLVIWGLLHGSYLAVST